MRSLESFDLIAKPSKLTIQKFNKKLFGHLTSFVLSSLIVGTNLIFGRFFAPERGHFEKRLKVICGRFDKNRRFVTFFFFSFVY
jgi:hypothetical protein